MSTPSERQALTKKVENNGFASPAEVVDGSLRVSAHNAMTRNNDNCGRDDATIKSK